ncbi:MULTISPECIES: GNAT family N-acetyltransferase [Citromicrobium]|uniref:GNAT family N-acetyltransferase n=1 Tax=Citromicrobium TaxID=72173 RepID=UPI0001DD0863|nr:MULTISPECIES: GNAT family N-acetyltransferase [Citromicrobium]ALG59905.1 GCN5 family acetyltransferase [Citromicrobium sp. JL477]KPM14453.1 GCN5 family acetyltransferase [Citromicrobium sp. JL31]KPM16999.1 GCN5 family acetyltransferase [Citromicrobium sp. JL1351]KPM27405.1 GCN5 family acetyltransferase [Citromicrobium sp. JL2201]
MGEFRHQTDRLTLRDWREEDWPLFWEGTNTPAVMRWLGGVCDADKRAGAQDRLLGYQRDHGHTFWVLERKADGAILGFCGLKRCNQAGGPLGMMEVGWRLREDAWGQGYAREAATASLDLAFERYGADEVVALTVARNIASWGLMVRLGMQRREDLDFANADFDPEEPTIIVYSITQREWQAARG